MKISVIGSGCATCKRLHEAVIKAVKEDNIDAEVEYSTDITRIVEMGFMRSPVLAIDGQPIDFKSNSDKDVKEALSNALSVASGCCADGDVCDIKCAPTNNDDGARSCCGGNR